MDAAAKGPAVKEQLVFALPGGDGSTFVWESGGFWTVVGVHNRAAIHSAETSLLDLNTGSMFLHFAFIGVNASSAQHNTAFI